MLKINNDNIKVVVSDIDGTMCQYTEDGERFISPGILKMIKELSDEKIYFVLNTGNSVPMMDDFSKSYNAGKSKYLKYFVGLNGNVIHDFSTSISNVVNLIPSNIVEELYKSLLPLKALIAITSKDGWVQYLQGHGKVEDVTSFIGLDNEKQWKNIDEMKSFESSPHITIKVNNPKIKEAVLGVANKYSDLIAVSWWSEDGVDINIKDSNKYSGLNSLIKILNENEGEDISIDNVVYFGDQNNDMSVFDNIKYAIAMGNAIETIKAKAFAITDSYKVDGVAKYIDSIKI
ncbi:HAD-IIB family hydrolase [Spiroplasma endosymbiont of Othius punctulatus]|uniref:HAD-IIB family hydrolase n=1 Tax=Spiroplasma endosymbiont of Othius punctulatus TaxID=3066289 RepID=UPI0030D4C6B9